MNVRVKRFFDKYHRYVGVALYVALIGLGSQLLAFSAVDYDKGSQSDLRSPTNIVLSQTSVNKQRAPDFFEGIANKKMVVAPGAVNSVVEKISINLNLNLTHFGRSSSTECEDGTIASTYCEMEIMPTFCPRDYVQSTKCPHDLVVPTYCPDRERTPTHCPREKKLATSCEEGFFPSACPVIKTATHCAFTGETVPTFCEDEVVVSTQCQDDQFPIIATQCRHRIVPTYCPEGRVKPTECPYDEELSTNCLGEKTKATYCEGDVILPTNCPHHDIATYCPDAEVLPTHCPDGGSSEDCSDKSAKQN